MPIVTIAPALIDEDYNAVRLARYAQRVGYPECAFWGVYNSSDEQNSCYPIKGIEERTRIAFYLGEAQDEIEQVCGYPLSPHWFVDEQHPSACTIHTVYGYVIDLGVRATSNISLGAAVSYITEPATIGPIATTVTDEDEVHIYHPGTDIEIDPSSITIAGGFVTIEIPRCRLVSDPDNPAEGWDYTDIPPSATTPFESTVDVKRVYNDDSAQPSLVWPHRNSPTCDCSCGCNLCAEYTEVGCGYIRNATTGAIDIVRVEGCSIMCCACYGNCMELVRINYYAGLTTLTKQAEDAIIRLAHSKMPKPPCGCGELMEMWTRDRNVPAILDSARLGCPFGLSDGAWQAWRFANAMKLYRAGIL